MNITYVPLPNELLVRLTNRYQTEYAGVIEHAIDSFLDRTEEDWQLCKPSDKGMSWDQLFLPENTKLRTTYKKIVLTAEIIDGKVLFNDNYYDSPSKACHVMRGSKRNNAWVNLEIKRPQDITFRLADRFRS